MILRSQTGSSFAPDSPEFVDDFAVLGVVYRSFDREHGPRLFQNPLAIQSDAMAYAQAEFFLPRPRYRCCPWQIETERGPVNNRDPWPRDWDSYNQTWSPAGSRR